MQYLVLMWRTVHSKPTFSEPVHECFLHSCVAAPRVPYSKPAVSPQARRRTVQSALRRTPAVRLVWQIKEVTLTTSIGRDLTEAPHCGPFPVNLHQHSTTTRPSYGCWRIRTMEPHFRALHFPSLLTGWPLLMSKLNSLKSQWIRPLAARREMSSMQDRYTLAG